MYIYVAHSLPLELLCYPFFKCFFVSWLRNHNSIICYDHNSKVNVLPQHAAPSILFKFSGTEAKSIVNLHVYGPGNEPAIFLFSFMLLLNHIDSAPIK
jgi:hypothetical protein